MMEEIKLGVEGEEFGNVEPVIGVVGLDEMCMDLEYMVLVLALKEEGHNERIGGERMRRKGLRSGSKYGRLHVRDQHR